MGTNTAFTWWNQKGPKPTQAEMAESQLELAEEAARQESVWRERFRRLQALDPSIGECMTQITRHKSEQAHFRRAAAWHRAEAEQEERQAAAAAARVAEQRRREAEATQVVPEPGAQDLEPWELDELGVTPTQTETEPRWDRGAPT